MSNDPFSDDEEFLQMCLDLEAAENNKTSLPTAPVFIDASAVSPNTSAVFARKCLEKNFGFKHFKDLQWRVIQNVLQKLDQCVVMATGYGKSLCFQFPAVYRRQLSVVISPLISLMEDQVNRLQLMGIPACLLGSSHAAKKFSDADLRSGKFLIVYMTPEYTMGELGLALLDELNSSQGVALIAIDEAHCISQWGPDFRDSYRQLGRLKESFPTVPILALTATATQKVVNDIVSSLKLRNCVVTKTALDRPNLYLEVQARSKSIADDLRRFIKRTQMSSAHIDDGGSTIVYCPTRKLTEEVGAALRVLGVDCVIYHAGLGLKERREAHENFGRNNPPVIVATVAFGMGIDKPDVRRIIHYAAPQDIESYFQEIGRAGRDGLGSKCTLFFSGADFVINRHFISEYKNPVHRRHKEHAFQQLIQYLNTDTCRRRFLLNYFEDSSGSERFDTADCCDNCRNREKANIAGQPQQSLIPRSEQDFSSEARMLFEAIRTTGQYYGFTVPIMLLRGSRSKKLRTTFYSDALFGAGKNHTDSWWKALGRLLVADGWLTERSVSSSAYGCAVQLHDRAVSWLDNGSAPPILLTPSADMITSVAAKQKTPVKSDSLVSNRGDSTEAGMCGTGPINAKAIILSPVKLRQWPRVAPYARSSRVDRSPIKPIVQEDELVNTLYKRLMELCNQLADELNVKPYMIAANRVLLDLATIRPSTRAHLQEMEGFAEAQIECYGDRILDAIRSECDRLGLSLDVGKVDNEKVPLELKTLLAELNTPCRETYALFELEGKPLEFVAEVRGVRKETVMSNLATAAKLGLPVDTERLGVNLETMESVLRIIRAPPINSDISKLDSMKKQCPELLALSSGQLNLVLAIFHYEYLATAGMQLAKTAAFNAAEQPASSNYNDSQLHSTAALQSPGTCTTPVVTSKRPYTPAMTQNDLTPDLSSVVPQLSAHSTPTGREDPTVAAQCFTPQNKLRNLPGWLQMGPPLCSPTVSGFSPLIKRAKKSSIFS